MGRRRAVVREWYDYERRIRVADLLIASSPVEIEAKADEAGLGEEFEERAIALFHDLTGDLDLLSLDLRKEQAAEWPNHRFYFGRMSGGIGKVLAALQTVPDAMRLEKGSRRPRAPAILCIHREAGEFAAILLACASEDLLRTAAAEIEQNL
jgi:hypothetical protein